jgi:hypothetical protein
MVSGSTFSLSSLCEAALSEAPAGGCSASKYAGCNGGGAGWSEGSAGAFLRRCKRSRIHLRIKGF